MDKWDKRFLDLAKLVSSWSKDPSTKVGAVIVDDNRRIVSCGFNGFSQVVIDSEEDYNDRETKYSKIIHGEINAILFAQRDLTGCTLYTYPFMPCDRCAPIVSQAGIVRVVTLFPTVEQIMRWGDSFGLSISHFDEASIQLVQYTHGEYYGK